MKYTKLFDIRKTQPALEKYLTGKKPKKGDRRDGLVYLYTPAIELLVNAALATARPILLRGPSGSGKSSLAKNVALRLKRRYYEEVITSRTQHSDLLWNFDLLRRFHDSQIEHGLKDDADYLEPRALWWAFDPDSAKRRGLKAPKKPNTPAVDPSQSEMPEAVVLVDEIDKADPDVPNNLLVTLGSLEFTPPGSGATVTAKTTPLVFLTSNDERELPAAFLRRCLVLELKAPERERLLQIASKHFGASERLQKLYEKVADALFTAAEAPGDRKPSTAEYLDTVRACIELKIQPRAGDDVWETLVRVTVRKSTRAGDGLVK